ncbi:MAG TPA: hypothetical protein DEV22_03245 [Collinsella sp.]|nr:hypothetical protein [Collinsella sp.]
MPRPSVMAEVIAYLKNNMDVRVASEVPASRPAQMVTVERTGGTGSALLDEPRVDVDTWANSDAEALSLSDEVTELMYRLPDASDTVSEVTRTSQYRSDVDGSHRWTATFNITRNV